MKAAYVEATAAVIEAVLNTKSNHIKIEFNKVNMKGAAGICKHVPKNRKARLAKKRKEILKERKV